MLRWPNPNTKRLRALGGTLSKAGQGDPRVGRRQNPGFIQKIGELKPASARPPRLLAGGRTAPRSSGDRRGPLRWRSILITSQLPVSQWYEIIGYFIWSKY